MERSVNAVADRNLIYDLGVNHGEDTDFYLAKGFQVVGVEADPRIVDELKERFADSIASGRFVLEPVGLMEGEERLPFYRNITCDHWSSFIQEYGCRGSTEFEVIDVPCVTLRFLIEKYGCPYYLKVDIEGADRKVLKQLGALDCRPTYLSVEEFGTSTIDELAGLGYNMFSIRPQLDKTWATPPIPPREGNYCPWDFTNRDSGLFGLEVPDWMPIDSAKAEFHRSVRSVTNEWLPPPGEWYDIHATVWPSTDEDFVANG
jgi:FkbM family methyltransferase